MNNRDKIRVNELLLKSLSEEIGEQEFSELNQLLKKEAELCRYHKDIVSIYQNLSDHGSIIFSVKEGVEGILDDTLWRELAEHEKQAPLMTADHSDSTPKAPIIHILRKVEKEPFHLRKGPILTFFGSLAAFLAILAYVFISSSLSIREVATVTDQIGVRWDRFSASLNNGDRVLTAQDAYSFKAGFLKVLYDQGVEVVIEGPAEFRFVSAHELSLISGKLYATVSATGVGFAVETNNSRTTDLGTEFGIIAQQVGDTEIHVFSGKVSLIPEKDERSTPVFITEGQARQVLQDGGRVRDVALRNQYFTKAIDSRTNTIWRGETFSLASVVAGGNGFTPGTIETGIDPASGKINRKAVQSLDRVGAETYNEVQTYRFIDGVFVPNGNRPANQVSSAGHVFSGFPATSGSYWSDISANLLVLEMQDKNQKIQTLRGAGEASQPSILVHANAGITFDLNEIRRANPGFDLTAFTTRCEWPSMWEMEAEYWILIDGVCVFHCTADDVRKKMPEVNVPIQPYHSFLTLATTDGQDEKAYDWCLFVGPEILLEPKR